MTAGCRVEVFYMLIAGSINSGYLFLGCILRGQPSETISLQAVFITQEPDRYRRYKHYKKSISAAGDDKPKILWRMLSRLSRSGR